MAIMSLLYIMLILLCVNSVMVSARQTETLSNFMATSRPKTFYNDWVESFAAQIKIDGSNHNIGSGKADKIGSLPGQPMVDFDQYGGYINVDERASKDLFYYFVESPTNSSNKPLMLWLNGGPGCSSISNGAFQEIGPFRVKSDGEGLFINPYAWNTVVNVLFLDSPAGVGFSVGISTVYNNTGDISTAIDTYAFLVQWLDRFPTYKSRDLYIGGESYIGHYGSELAHIILQKKNPSIKLKGLMMGNPLLNDALDTAGAYDFLWSRGMYSDELRFRLFISCNFSEFYTSKQCTDITDEIEANWGDFQVFNVYAPTCDDLGRNHTPIVDSVEVYNPCGPSSVTHYINLKEVQRALHARRPEGGLGLCTSYLWQDSPVTVYQLIKNLISNNVSLLVYSGDFDGRIPFTATKNDIKEMNLNVKTPWRPWYTNKKLGGYLEEYQGLLFVTIRGAGHEVPIYQPQRILSVLSSFLNGSLPTSNQSDSDYPFRLLSHATLGPTPNFAVVISTFFVFGLYYLFVS